MFLHRELDTYITQRDNHCRIHDGVGQHSKSIRETNPHQKGELNRGLRLICTKLDEGNVGAGNRTIVGKRQDC